MKKLLQRFIFVLCLTPLGINDTQAAAAPAGFVHILNRAANENAAIKSDLLTNVHYDADDIAKLIAGEPLYYNATMVHGQETQNVEYSISLAEHQEPVNLAKISARFGPGGKAPAWLEFVNAAKAEGVTTVTYTLKSMIGSKVFPFGDFALVVKRYLPTIAGKATNDLHENHILMENHDQITRPFKYKDHFSRNQTEELWYKIAEEDLATISGIIEAVETDAQHEDPPKAVFRTFYEKGANDKADKTMRGVLYLEETKEQPLERIHECVIPTCEAPVEEHHE